jgi:hypothetical protein
MNKLPFPLCLGCQSLPPREALMQWPCVNCGRQLRHVWRHHFAETFCSEEREDAVYARRERRRERRQRWREGAICICCGGSFQPKRRGDAITCSSACRQRMYRKRVTDRLKDASPPSLNL